MKKIAAVFILTIMILIVSVFLYFRYIPILANIDVTELEKVDTAVSPNKEKELNIYFRGGVFFYTDYTYVGEVTNLKNNKKQNVFLLPESKHDIKWKDDNTILIDGKELKVNETYDFRHDKLDERNE